MSTSALKLAPAQIIQELLSLPVVIEAFRFFELEANGITQEHIEICSIPASPFGEQRRAEYLRDKFIEIGLSDVNIDKAGNCLGMFKGTEQVPLMVVSAHLDTVFSETTDFTVRRHEQRLLAPGISDDGCGLAALIAIAHALLNTQARTTGSILF